MSDINTSAAEVENHSPDKKPFLVQLVENHKTVEIVELFEKDGITYELIRKPKTIYAGKLGYASEKGREPDINAIYQRMYGKGKQASLERLRGMTAPEWDVCISIDYWKGKNACWGMMFAREVATIEQEPDIDVLVFPASMYVRVLYDIEAAEKTGGNLGEAWRLFNLINDEFMPEYGYGRNGECQEMEYRLDPNQETMYAYVPVIKLDAEDAEKQKDEISRRSQEIVNETDIIKLQVNKLLGKLQPAGKAIDNVMPVRPSVNMSPACMASLVMKIKKENENVRLADRERLRDSYYKALLAAGGLGFGFVYDKKFIVKKAGSHYVPAYKAYPESLAAEMRFAGLSFTRLDRKACTDKECFEKLRASIDEGVPVMAEGIVTSQWCLITGYLADGSVIGWRCDDFVYDRDLDKLYTEDKILENGMFLKKNWFDDMLQLVFATGQSNDTVSYRELLPYWIGIMRKPENELFSYGEKAYDDIIRFLQDDDFFGTCDSETLKWVYGYVYDFGRLAEARIYTSQARNTLLFCNRLDFETKAGLKKLQDALKPFNNIHNQVWDMWKKVGRHHIGEPDKYAEGLRSKAVRSLMISYIEGFKKDDARVLEALESIIE